MSRLIEKAKIDLAICYDFNLISAFRMFDVEGRGYVTYTEYERACMSIGIKA